MPSNDDSISNLSFSKRNNNADSEKFAPVLRRVDKPASDYASKGMDEGYGITEVEDVPLVPKFMERRCYCQSALAPSTTKV
jgi:hypothetical protein